MKKYLYLLTAIILMASVQTVFAQKTKLMNKQQFNDNITETNNVKPQKGQSVKVPKYVDLGPPSGTLWATFNIGASAPEEAGLFFAWGETKPKDNYTWTNYQHCDGTYLTMNKYCTDDYYGTVDGKTQLEPADDAATVLLGKGWSMPTKEQFEELVYNENKYTTCTITTQNSVQGLLVTSVINDASIFLPIGGFLTCLFLGWYVPKQVVKDEFTNWGTLGSGFFNIYILLVRYVCPLAILAIFLHQFNLI